MLAGDFQRRLRRMNKELRVFCGDSNRAAGLYHVVNGEYEELCGIDKNYVPEFPTCEPNGRIIRRGWRSVVQLLIGRKLVSRDWAQKVFSTHFDPPRYIEAPAREDRRSKLANKLHSLGMEMVEQGTYKK